jgi:hypothetical protein
LFFQRAVFFAVRFERQAEQIVEVAKAAITLQLGANKKGPPMRRPLRHKSDIYFDLVVVDLELEPLV